MAEGCLWHLLPRQTCCRHLLTGGMFLLLHRIEHFLVVEIIIANKKYAQYLLQATYHVRILIHVQHICHVGFWNTVMVNRTNVI